jgi:ribonuclease R
MPAPPEIRLAVIKLLRNHGSKAFRPKELAKSLGYKRHDDYRAFHEALAELVAEGLVQESRGGRVQYRPKPARLEGTIRVHPKGFAFVRVEGQDEDLYISEHNVGTALDGDRVRVGMLAPRRGDRRREAEVLAVLERTRKQAVGTFWPRGALAFVAPDDQRLVYSILIEQDAFGGARPGDKVVASIDAFDDRHETPIGRVLQVLGPASDPATRVLALALSYDAHADFPADVLAEASALPQTIPAPEIARRRDLRDRRVFTIDPVDAKDFDDALHIDLLPNGHFEVGVHIADVGYYVRPETALDREAFARATSIYLVDRVLPMLPEPLSNGACSLRPHEDKLAFSCLMEVTPEGRLRRYEIVETVIHSHHRFTYEEAQALLDDPGSEHPFATDLHRAGRLAAALTHKRFDEGSIDFDLPEVRVELDAAGKPLRIYVKERKASNRLIEEFMLLANRTVTEHIATYSQPRPFVYRIHEPPDPEKIRQLARYVRTLGYQLELDKRGNITAKTLNALLEQVKGTPQAPVVEEAALRSMAKARYSTANPGHYGLGFTHYTHFTSPIRRYPDLIAHRLLKQYAAGGADPDPEALQAQCEHCSERERAAETAERESVKLKQVEYIQQHLGEQFDGIISSVATFGLFVELTANLVEGLVHVRDMGDDYFEYDERTYRLVGQYTGRSYRIGQTVTVQVVRANLETRAVDFVLIET